MHQPVDQQVTWFMDWVDIVLGKGSKRRKIDRKWKCVMGPPVDIDLRPKRRKRKARS